MLVAGCVLRCGKYGNTMTYGEYFNQTKNLITQINYNLFNS